MPKKPYGRDATISRLRDWRRELFAARCGMVAVQHRHDQGTASDEERDKAVQRYSKAEIEVGVWVERAKKLGLVVNEIEEARG